MTDPRVDGDLIVFDGHCLLCSGFVRFVSRRDRVGRFRYVTAQSPLGRALYARYGLDPDAMETNIVVIDGRPHVRMASFAAAMAALGWPWRALALAGVLPRFLGDPLYRFIANNRYRLGRRSCPLPSAALRDRLIE
ncbi:MAG: DCC1-like thiol-disulfide oxidoreductase family protein [Zavarzinia sp.]|nr:DCC1-like thiol-disulfide oxidoreductase family protein [Zavarzinia sp.]